MNNKFLYVLLISILGLLGLNYYNQVQFNKRQQQIEASVIEQKNIGDGITRSLSKYATADDFKKAIESNKMDLQKIQEDVKKIGTYIGAISIVSVSSMGQSGDGIASTSHRNLPRSETPRVETCSNMGNTISCIDDKYNYYTTIQSLNLDETFKDQKIPFGTVSFSASKQNPWGVSIPAREYKLSTVSSFDENQRMVNYNKFIINTEGKEYIIPIDSAQVVQQYPEDKFRWFSPRLFLGLDAGLNLNNSSFYFGPSVHLGIMNYGKFNNNPDFSILQLGASVNTNSKDVYFGITPVAYNIGRHLPMIDNTYLGPSFNFSPATKESAILLGARVGL